jgi:hypothetical protein
MQALRDKLPLWAAALWWGSLSTIGFLVVPLLFLHLPSKAMAGAMAARLFTAQTWVTVVCALLLLLASRPRGEEEGPGALHGARLFIVGGLLLALLVELAIAPRIVARENLALWHRLGTAMYVVQWLCAAATFWSLSRKA